MLPKWSSPLTSPPGMLFGIMGRGEEEEERENLPCCKEEGKGGKDKDAMAPLTPRVPDTTLKECHQWCYKENIPTAPEHRARVITVFLMLVIRGWQGSQFGYAQNIAHQSSAARAYARSIDDANDWPFGYGARSWLPKEWCAFHYVKTKQNKMNPTWCHFSRIIIFDEKMMISPAVSV